MLWGGKAPSLMLAINVTSWHVNTKQLNNKFPRLFTMIGWVSVKTDISLINIVLIRKNRSAALFICHFIGS